MCHAGSMTSSLRDAKRAATRRALADATYRRVREHGFDGVTIEEITTDVNVSRRTFSNYFANKEEAVAFVPVDRIRAELEEWVVPEQADIPTAVRSVVGHLMNSGLPLLLAELDRLGRSHTPFGPHAREAQWAVWEAVGDRLRAELLIDDPRERRNLAMLLGALYGIVSARLAESEEAADLAAVQESVAEVFTWLEPAIRGQAGAPGAGGVDRR